MVLGINISFRNSWDEFLKIKTTLQQRKAVNASAGSHGHLRHFDLCFLVLGEYGETASVI